MRNNNRLQEKTEVAIHAFRRRLAKQKQVVAARQTAKLIKQLIDLHKRLGETLSEEQKTDPVLTFWVERLPNVKTAKAANQIVTLVREVLDVDQKIGALKESSGKAPD